MRTERELLRLALDALRDNRVLIESWGRYAAPYIQEKHGLKADIRSNDVLIDDIEFYIEHQARS